MEFQSENFLELVASHLNNKEPVLRNPDWEQIYSLANIHSLHGIVYCAIRDRNICDNADIERKLNAAFMNTVKFSVIQEVVVSELINILNNNGIRHIMFKGYVLKNLYPVKELRTMGDIDIIIDKTNQNKVHELLMTAGFEFDELNSKHTVRNYSKQKVYFEIHTEIMSKNLFYDVDAVEYFADNFKHTKNVDKFTYEFSNDHHLVYMLMHMACHFKNGGCGVRMLMDLAVFNDKLGKSLDWKYIEEQLDYLGIIDFSKNIFNLCNLWFGSNISFAESKLENSDIENIGKYILAGGVFGGNDRNFDAIRINADNSSLPARIKNLLKLIFPDYDSIKSRYVWFEGTPKWLLPVGWVRLWWYRVVVNKENSFKRIKLALSSNDDAAEHIKMMKIIGLKHSKL